MKNKLMKNLTIANIIIICLVFPFAMLGLVGVEYLDESFNALTITSVSLILLLALASGTIDIVRGVLGKRSNAISKKIDARKTMIIYLTFGIVSLFLTFSIGTMLILYFIAGLGYYVSIPVMVIVAALDLLTGIASLITDCIGINDLRKNKKEA